MSIGSCSAIKTNQWLGGVQRAYGYAARHSPPKWAGLLASPPHLRFLLFSDEDPSSLTLRWNASAAELDLLQRSTCRRRAGLPCTLMTVTLSVCHAWGNRTLTDRFLFRELLFSESDVGSMSACLAFTAQRAFASPLHSAWSASLRGCERDLVSVGVTSRWMKAFLWWLRTRRSCRALWLTLPYCHHPLHATPDSERMRSSSISWQRLSMSSGSSGLRLRSHLAAGWTSGFSQGAIKPPANACPPSSPKSTMSSLNRDAPPTHLAPRPSASGALTSIDGKGYELLPPLDESRPDTFRQDRGIESGAREQGVLRVLQHPLFFSVGRGVTMV